jgi:hypothetical protein
MTFSAEAVGALNEYLDRVNRALALPPSTRIPIVDRLYRQIAGACETKAHQQSRLAVGLDLVEAELAALGAPEALAAHLTEEHLRWSPEAFGFDRAQFAERASAFARAAAERGGEVFFASIETAANALDVASQKLREAADRFKAKI